MSAQKCKWTPCHQAELDRLTEQKSQFEKQAMAPLRVLVLKLDICVGTLSRTDEVALALSNNADALRDALAPFDSGIRPQVDRRGE